MVQNGIFRTLKLASYCLLLAAVSPGSTVGSSEGTPQSAMSGHGTSVVGRSSIGKREKTAGTLRIVGFFARWAWQLCGRTEKCPSRS